MDLFSAIVKTVLILFSFFSLTLTVSYIIYKIKSKRKEKIRSQYKSFHDLYKGLDYYEILNTPLEEEKIITEKKFSIVNSVEINTNAH
jgi:hypothetical protein